MGREPAPLNALEQALKQIETGSIDLATAYRSLQTTKRGLADIQSKLPATPSNSTRLQFERLRTLATNLETRLLLDVENEMMELQVLTSTLTLEFHNNPVWSVLYAALPQVRLERAKRIFSESPEAQDLYVKSVGEFLERHLDFGTGPERAELLDALVNGLTNSGDVSDDMVMQFLKELWKTVQSMDGADAIRVRSSGPTTTVEGGIEVLKGGAATPGLEWFVSAIDQARTTFVPPPPPPRAPTPPPAPAPPTPSGGARRHRRLAITPVQGGDLPDLPLTTQPTAVGGYTATERDKEYLRKWKRGESIGFTMTASLKAKGLIPRTSKSLKGKKVVSSKYT